MNDIVAGVDQIYLLASVYSACMEWGIFTQYISLFLHVIYNVFPIFNVYFGFGKVLSFQPSVCHPAIFIRY